MLNPTAASGEIRGVTFRVQSKQVAEKLVPGHPEIAPVLRNRRIGFALNTRKNRPLAALGMTLSEKSLSTIC